MFFRNDAEWLKNHWKKKSARWDFKNVEIDDSPIANLTLRSLDVSELYETDDEKARFAESCKYSFVVYKSEVF